MRRLGLAGAACLAAVALVLAAREPGGVARNPDPAASAAAARSLLLARDEGGCDCTGEARARDRVASGLAAQPHGTVILTAP